MNEKVQGEIRFRQMREEDEQFNNFVTTVETAISSYILKKQQKQSFSQKGYKIRIKVDRVPITEEQEAYLMQYLTFNYIKYAKGHFFILKKCWFSNKYLIKDLRIPDYLIIS